MEEHDHEHALDIRNGDWVMSRPAPGKEQFFHKGILLIANHTHDELIHVSDDGSKISTGNAHAPHFELTPFSESVEDWRKGRRLMAVFRWAEFSKAPMGDVFYSDYRMHVQACLELLADLKVPYDNAAITSHARNYFRKKLRYIGWLGPVVRHTEYKVYCTESCWSICRVAGVNCDVRLGKKEPLPAPCHSEQLYELGYLVCVEDFGLLQHFKRPRLVESSESVSSPVPA